MSKFFNRALRDKVPSVEDINLIIEPMLFWDWVKTKRNAEIVRLADEGYTYANIGVAFNISGPRVRQIVTRAKRRSA